MRLASKAGLGVRVVSDTDRSLQGLLRKRRRMNSRQRRHRRAARSPVEAFSGVAICVASLQERLGLTTIDANFSAMWLTRDKLGTTFLAHLGLMDLSDLLGLSKGLEDRRAKILMVCCSDFGHRVPFSFLNKRASDA